MPGSGPSPYESMLKQFILAASIAAAAAFAYWWFVGVDSAPQWTESEVALLSSLSLEHLPELDPDPTNRVADLPAAAQLGHQLFFDTRLSANGAVSCATCHRPNLFFTDGLEVGHGLGRVARHTMSLIGVAYSPWFFWDGRKDSLWSQALGPLEDPLEHGITRVRLVQIISANAAYRSAYEKLFGPLPDFSNLKRFPSQAAPVGYPAPDAAWASMRPEDQNAVNVAFSNIGKALAAYQRLLKPGESRFDRYVAAVVAGDMQRANTLLTPEQSAGAKLFVGKGQCTNCHNGPLLTNNEFHNTSVLSAQGQVPALGRAEGVRKAFQDPFNCLGPYSDDPEKLCSELRFTRVGKELVGTQRTPSLRNVAETPPYMHAGQIPTLKQALEQYNSAPDAMIGHNEAKPLGLRPAELAQLEAFLHTLTGQPDVEARWLKPPEGQLDGLVTQR